MVEELQPVVPAPAQVDHSIMALIRRLEDGLARRASNDTDPEGSGIGAMPLSRSWIVPENVEASPMADDFDASPMADDFDASPMADDGDNSVRQALGTLRRMAGR